MLKWD